MSRARAAVLGLGLLVAGCTGSESATPDSTPEADADIETDADGEIFSEGETETVEGDGADESGSDADSNADEETDGSSGEPDATVAPDDGDDSAASTDGDVDQDGSDADSQSSGGDDGAETDPPDTNDAGDPDDSGTGAGGSEGSGDADPDTRDADDIDDIDDLITIDDVDDVPFCQAYANVFEAFLGISFAGAFGQVGSADPDALVSLSETYEVLVYPGLAPDVETIRDEDVENLERFFAPLFERIDAAPGLLRDAGMSDAEIESLTESVRPFELEAVDLDALDPRVTDAAVALVAEFGTFFDASESLAAPDSDADAEGFEAELSELCPLLNETFGDG